MDFVVTNNRPVDPGRSVRSALEIQHVAVTKESLCTRLVKNRE